MPAIDVEEVQLVGLEAVVADAEPKQVAVEGQQRLDILDVQHAWPMPSGPVWKPEIGRPGWNGSVATAGP